VSIRERPDRPKVHRRCKNCGINFETDIDKKKFCSNRCRWQYHQSGGIPLYVVQAMVRESVLKYSREAMLSVLVEFKLVRPEMITKEGKFLG
jgi:protein-arginine kinase activator protein McsA